MYFNSTHIFIVHNANYTIFNNKVKGEKANLESLVKNYYSVRVLRKKNEHLCYLSLIANIFKCNQSVTLACEYLLIYGSPIILIKAVLTRGLDFT